MYDVSLCVVHVQLMEVELLLKPKSSVLVQQISI